MTKNEFKIGDTVRFKGKKKIHTITGINEYGHYIVSEYPKWSFSAEYLEHAELPDRKTAFLTELQALLRKYDAKIESCAEGTEDSWIDIYFGDECLICFDRNPQTCCATITADNIMDFDKE